MDFSWLVANWQMMVVVALLFAALTLFLTEAIPFEMTSLLVLVVLAATGILTITEAYSGFSNTAMLTVLMMFILSEAILQVGLIDWLGERVAPWFGSNTSRQVFVIVLLVAPVSAFINNAAAVAVLIPLIVRLASERAKSPSKLLIPLSYAAMLGGTITVIGTSTNLLANDLSIREGLGGFSMFEFAPVGIIVLLVGAAYLILIGHRLIPPRARPGDIESRYHLRSFFTQARIPEDSLLIGQTVGAGKLAGSYDADVIDIRRGGYRLDLTGEPPKYMAGDVIVLEASRAHLQEMTEAGLVELIPTEGEEEFDVDDRGFAELLVPYDSPARGKRLDQLDLPSRHGVRAVAILAAGLANPERLGRRRLRDGDVILVRGKPEELVGLTGKDEFHVLGGPAIRVRRRAKIPLVIVTIIGVVGLAALGIAPILLTATAAVVILVAGGALRAQEMYRAIHWDVILLLAGIIPLGLALEKTGGAAAAAGVLAIAGPHVSPIVLLTIVYVLTMILTELVSNNAAILLIGPIAINLANQLGYNPITFLLAAMFAASTPFLTPIGYKTNLLVFSPGGYRFGDYARAGAPLNLILAIVTPISLNYFFPIL